ncbi:DUF4271 domain-containing protein [Aquimarina sp. 2201CG14-23]|uniref:DUF4271 domain-containing protein n=1 Tax=Aquimarina mycalae TaxID=3040073 RepID=UPI002477F9B0|nr:DUF4271 domain-containing protein [Aquimarina sp. 2201CG14-23]MDH7446022.1 DUF4271 domain-containing protein [Aquimarina sp. 2201CG14-23]
MEIITREIISTDWITIVIIVCFSLLAIAKLVNSIQFSDFVMLFNTNKYIVLHQKGNKLSTPFNGLLMLVQILSVSLFLYLCLDVLEWQTDTINITLYFKIATLYLVVLICKILVEKIISTIFSIETLIEDYLFYKISYRNFLGVFLLPLNLLFIYTAKPSKIVLIILVVSLLILNLIVLFSIYKKNENIILNHSFYFILYLCALEIAPYFMLYKLII